MKKSAVLAFAALVLVLSGGLIIWYLQHFSLKIYDHTSPKDDNNPTNGFAVLYGIQFESVISDENDDLSCNKSKKVENIKTILSINGFEDWWSIKESPYIFSGLNCPVSTCRWTQNWNEKDTADMVLYSRDPFYLPSSPKQVQALIQLETPAKKRPFLINTGAINWTISYRHDSTIAIPYGKWVYFNSEVKQKKQTQNYAMNKKKKVAWIVSNCETKNNRLEYALELQKYIQVDIYGRCGPLKCGSKQDCLGMIKRDYKFYLAFENSNCKEYITEKFFENALMQNILPVVMGAPREDYQKYAPFQSYIHVEDFQSPERLAAFLNHLDQNDDSYNEYFMWKGTGKFIDWTDSLCQICDKLHDDDFVSSQQHYDDINKWWRPAGICTNGFWRDINSTKAEQMKHAVIRQNRHDEEWKPKARN